MTPAAGRWQRWALAGLLAVVSLAGLSAAASAVTQDHRIDMRSTDPGTVYEAFDATTMAVVDLNGDGHKEIVAHNDNNNAYVFDGATGELDAELSTNHPDGWSARPLGGPALGDVTGNGVSDIVLVNSAAWATAFEARGDGAGGVDVTRLWETRLDPREQDPDRDWENPATDAAPFLADTNDGGRDETFAQLDDQPSVFKLTPDGHVDTWNDHSDGNAGPVVGDLTGDGTDEAVVPSDGGTITIYEAESMDWRCQFDARLHEVWPGSISVSPTLADVTSDGRLEIVFGLRNVDEEQDEGWIEDSNAHYFAVDADCNVVWQKTWDWSNPHVHMRPAPVDVTGDGSLDIVFQDWNTVGHKPGDWQHTGPSNLFAVEGSSGELLWRTEVANYWSNKNIAIGDVTGDGRADIVANEVDAGDGFGIYSLQGEKKGFVSAPDGWVVSKGAVLADLDQNGDKEIVLPVHRDSDGCETNTNLGCREGAIQIYDTSAASGAVYDNNHLRNADEARAQPTGDPQPPPDDGDDSGASGEFEASFEKVRGNEWWIETDVDASDTIASVHARVDGGDWRALEHRDWGSWADDIHAPQGAIVQFQARNDAGDRAVSGCYAWGEEPTSTTCPEESSDDGDAGGSFSADFVEPRGNEWWIEVDVDSDRSITSVEVRLDGGSWTGLDKQDWGSWARSEHAPQGTVVQFRAHSGSSATTTSGCYAWGEDPTSTSCTDDSGDGGDTSGSFSADFVEPRGNEWWIEVDVDASAPLESVSAYVDGEEVVLHRTDWGSWAANTEAGGASVHFEAAGEDGGWDRSSTIAWPP